MILKLLLRFFIEFRIYKLLKLFHTSISSLSNLNTHFENMF